MSLREPTIKELFPHAIEQDLFKKQSEHFVNNSLTGGNIAAGYKNMPTEFVSEVTEIPLVINSKPPKFFIVTYIKNNWRGLLVAVAGGLIIGCIIHKSKQKKTTKKTVGNLSKKFVY